MLFTKYINKSFKTFMKYELANLQLWTAGFDSPFPYRSQQSKYNRLNLCTVLVSTQLLQNRCLQQATRENEPVTFVVFLSQHAGHLTWRLVSITGFWRHWDCVQTHRTYLFLPSVPRHGWRRNSSSSALEDTLCDGGRSFMGPTSVESHPGPTLRW